MVLESTSEHATQSAVPVEEENIEYSEDTPFISKSTDVEEQDNDIKEVRFVRAWVWVFICMCGCMFYVCGCMCKAR